MLVTEKLTQLIKNMNSLKDYEYLEYKKQITKLSLEITPTDVVC